MRGLVGKVAVVTGGAGGIGEATVRRLLNEGVSVVFMDWNADAGTALVTTLGAGATFVSGDVANEGDCVALAARAFEQHGHIDILVNNAGIRNYQSLTETDAAGWDKILGVNLMGYIFCAKVCIPYMRDAGAGAIVNVASIRSLQAGKQTVQYDTSKAAILGLTRSIARDYADVGIRVNAVGPGPIYTPFHQQRAADASLSQDEYRAKFGAQTMLKRPAEAEEVANAITFLASADASYITGTCLYVDGGLTANGDT